MASDGFFFLLFFLRNFNHFAFVGGREFGAAFFFFFFLIRCVSTTEQTQTDRQTHLRSIDSTKQFAVSKRSTKHLSCIYEIFPTVQTV